MWKLYGTKLINKKGEWHSNDDWRFVPEQTMFYIENISNDKVLSVATENNCETEVKEMSRDNKLKQLWKLEPPNEEGFFNVSEPKSLVSMSSDSFHITVRND